MVCSNKPILNKNNITQKCFYAYLPSTKAFSTSHLECGFLPSNYWELWLSAAVAVHYQHPLETWGKGLPHAYCCHTAIKKLKNPNPNYHKLRIICIFIATKVDEDKSSVRQGSYSQQSYSSVPKPENNTDVYS